MVRQFKLINSTGLEWDLMRHDSFLADPAGLGLAKENEYMPIGSTYELTKNNPAQKTPAFRMIFKNYEIFRKFSDFIAYTPLKLAYLPAYSSAEWAYLDGSFSFLDKTEIDGDLKRLACDCTFEATSMWYIPRPARKTADDVESPKKYPYKYDYQYADELNGYIRVFNGASESSSALISILGPITNPSWYVSVNNDVLASGSVEVNIPEGNKMIVNSKDGHLEVAEYNASTNAFIRNLYQFTDFDRETFVRFPPGNSVLFIAGTNEGSINAWVEIEEVHDTL